LHAEYIHNVKSNPIIYTISLRVLGVLEILTVLEVENIKAIPVRE